MMPRTFQDIRNEVSAAVRRDDAVALAAYAEELAAMEQTDDIQALLTFTNGVLHGLQGRLVDAMAQYDFSRTIYDKLGDQRLVTIIMGNQANLLSIAGQYKEAIQRYREALPLHKALDDERGYARVLGNLANNLLQISEIDEARTATLDALARWEHLDDTEGRARMLVNLAQIDRRVGNTTAALAKFEEAQVLFTSINNQRYALLCRYESASNLVLLGDHAAAYEQLMRALDEVKALKDPASEAYILGHLLMVLSASGEYASAIDHGHRALVILSALDLPFREAELHNSIAVAYQRAGDLERAQRHLERAQQLIGEDGPPDLLASVLMNRALMFNDKGQYDEAVSLLRRTLAIHEETTLHSGLMHARANLVHGLLAIGDLDEAERELSRIPYNEVEDPAIRVVIHHGRGKLHLRRSEPANAIDEFTAALQIAEQHGIRELECESHEFLRDAYKALMDFEGFAKHSESAQRIANEIKGASTARQLAMLDVERTIAKERTQFQQQRQILLSTLPSHIVDRLIRGEDVGGDTFDNASVLFLDVVAFTSHTSSMPPADVVAFLADLFSAIDTICATHGVVKVKTVGDAYLCFKGDADPAANADAIARVALDVIALRRTWPSGAPLTFRIGLHAGPVTAGIIGTERLQYDIWGDTVNVASRMESTGEAGRIHVSEQFASFLDLVPHFVRNDSHTPTAIKERSVIPNEVRNEEPGTWHLALRGETEIKGKGLMTTYWLEGPIT